MKNNEVVLETVRKVTEGEISKREALATLAKSGNLDIKNLRYQIFDILASLEESGFENTIKTISSVFPEYQKVQSETQLRLMLLSAYSYQFGFVISFDRDLHPSEEKYRDSLTNPHGYVEIAKDIFENKQFRKKYISELISVTNLIMPGILEEESEENINMTIVFILDPFAQGFIDGYEVQLEEKVNILDILTEKQ